MTHIHITTNFLVFHVPSHPQSINLLFICEIPSVQRSSITNNASPLDSCFCQNYTFFFFLIHSLYLVNDEGEPKHRQQLMLAKKSKKARKFRFDSRHKFRLSSTLVSPTSYDHDDDALRCCLKYLQNLINFLLIEILWYHRTDES